MGAAHFTPDQAIGQLHPSPSALSARFEPAKKKNPASERGVVIQAVAVARGGDRLQVIGLHVGDGHVANLQGVIYR